MREHTVAPRPLAYPVKAAAELLGIGTTTTYALIKSGELASIKVGRRRLVPYDAVVAYLEAQRPEAGR